MIQPYALIGATIIDGTGADPVPDGCVVVGADGTIADVGERSRVEVPADARTLDVAGAVVMPGLIDCHCHLGGASLPDEDGWVLEDDRFQAIASVHQAGQLLRHGVTSARDISVNGPHLKKAIREGLIEGPRLVPCWRGLSRTGGHGDGLVISPEAVRRSHPWGIVADGPEQVRWAVREAVKNGAECIKVWASGGGLQENEPEDAQHYTLEELRIIVEEATLVRVPVIAHAESPSSARDAVAAGVWSIEHGEAIDAETMTEMGRRGTFLDPTLVLLRQWFEWQTESGPYGSGVPYVPGGGDLPTDIDELRAVFRERQARNLAAAREAGIRIAVGSDAYNTTMTPFGQQTLDEVHALVDAGLDPMEAIVAATRTGAESLRIDRRTGTLERGKDADLIVLGRDPLDDIANLAEEQMLLIAQQGRLVKESLS
ncbi:MAG TPA: amidohydrolase family protein [Candidatus Limnocylindrales bacterium]|nr:amidohydrolase family protein [Candidatus Limnocylindrales bacterium]